MAPRTTSPAMAPLLPLQPGTTRKVISGNIARLMRTHAFDENPKMAQALAYKQAGRSGQRRRRKP